MLMIFFIHFHFFIISKNSKNFLTSNQIYFSGDFGKNQPSVFKRIIEITLASSGFFFYVIEFFASKEFFSFKRVSSFDNKINK